jgi:hypothetical protein
MTKYRNLSIETRLKLAKVESILATGSKLEKLVLICNPVDRVKFLLLCKVWKMPGGWRLVVDSFLNDFSIVKAILEGRI